MSNYKPGRIRKVQDTALDTEADLSRADDELSVYPMVKEQRDAWQEKGYRKFRWVAMYSTDPDARKVNQSGLEDIAKGEGLEAINDEHVAECEQDLCEARGHNHEVVDMLEQVTDRPAGGGVTVQVQPKVLGSGCYMCGQAYPDLAMLVSCYEYHNKRKKVA